MATFDGWEAQLYGPNTLAHFRTRGSKNGVRRFQNEDGTWTPLGLKERKEREGWGQSRAERRAEKKEARAVRAEERREQRRKSNVRTMTDAELKKRIERLKLEQEYKSLKRSPVLETGRKMITSILEYKANKENREMEQKKLQIEQDRIKADVTKARENTRRAKADAEKAKHEAQKVEADVKGGIAYERKASLKRAKIDWKATTLHGGIVRRINAMLTSGVGEKQKAVRTAEGAVEAKKIMAKGDRDLKIWKRNSDRADSKSEAKRKRAGISDD